MVSRRQLTKTDNNKAVSVSRFAFSAAALLPSCLGRKHNFAAKNCTPWNLNLTCLKFRKGDFDQYLMQVNAKTKMIS